MLQHLVISDCLFVAKIAYSAVFEIGLSKREAVRSAILATAWLLVFIAQEKI